jgi:DNA-binding MarR family transcriptional regulator
MWLLSEELIDKISRLSVLLQTAVLQFGVSLAQARAMTTVFDEGPQRITDLACRQRVTQPTMTALVSGMERQGWIRREADGSDRRVVFVVLTPAGEDVIRTLRSARQSTLARYVMRLTAAERAGLAAAIPALDALIDRLQEGAGPALASSRTA